MIILGIDPGLAATGYGIVERVNETIRCIDYGTVVSSPNEALEFRLKTIYDGINGLIDKYKPSHAAFEDVFYGPNIQSALKLGQARGAAMIAAVNARLTVAIYSPKEVKQALTGYGAASKEQVQRMVAELLRLPLNDMPTDASDALAVALCHAQRLR
ncbi:MAG: crossover junction endodeoxyribonuclease RuvC [candidate division KSB1 bacterium]|nr:crossover junction endodeoxyribonuclease RuvC [candidate division KSB1 bacterium]